MDAPRKLAETPIAQFEGSRLELQPPSRRRPERIFIPPDSSLEQTIEFACQNIPGRRRWLEGIAQTQPNELRALHAITTALYEINIVLVRA